MQICLTSGLCLFVLSFWFGRLLFSSLPWGRQLPVKVMLTEKIYPAESRKKKKEKWKK